MKTEAIRIISLGWGVQSFALAAMSALGVLPPVDYAIHSNTGYERTETRDFAQRWTPWLVERGVKILTVSDIHHYGNNEDGNIFIPAYTTDGMKRGQLLRQCTGRWKIDPLRRFISLILNARGMTKSPGIVEQWIGITLDEIGRARPSDVKYINNIYPFVNLRYETKGAEQAKYLSRRWYRLDVVNWLVQNGLEVPVISACVICPYSHPATRRAIRDSGNGDWEVACRIDVAIRHKRPGYVAFVDRQLKPLSECNFDAPAMDLFPSDDAECSGHCFL